MAFNVNFYESNDIISGNLITVKKTNVKTANDLSKIDTYFVLKNTIDINNMWFKHIIVTVFQRLLIFMIASILSDIRIDK